MTTMTVERVLDEVREWKSPDGKLDLRFVMLIFTDGSEGSVSTKPDTVDKRLVQLKELIGKPAEFELEDKGEHHGAKQWKVTDYPGKSPQGGGWGKGGGGKGWQPKPPQERAEIMAQTMLNAVVSLTAEGHDFFMAVNYVAQAMAILLPAAKAAQEEQDVGAGSQDAPLPRAGSPAPTTVAEGSAGEVHAVSTGFGEGSDDSAHSPEEDGARVVELSDAPFSQGEEEARKLALDRIDELRIGLDMTMGALLLRARKDWGISMLTTNLTTLTTEELRLMLHKLTEATLAKA